MSLLVALPLLPLVAALWLALARRHSTPGMLELVSLAPVAAALFLADMTASIPYFLTTDVTVFELDARSRASLLLFGSLWLTAGLMDYRREQGRSIIPLLLGLSGAITVALARQAPAVLCGMLAAGFALCAIVARESGTASRRPVRVLAALLVASYLLLFEVLVHAAAEPHAGMSPVSAGMIILAVILSAGIPPAHAWQAAALIRASASTSLLLVGVPAGVALTGGSKLLGAAGGEFAPACLVLALVAALWSTWAGARRRSTVGTLACATAATASLLLAGLVVLKTPALTAWITLSLLTSTSALAVLRLQRTGPARAAGTIAVPLLHGVAAGQLALHAAGALPAIGGVAASVTAALATLLVTLTARRIAAMPVPGAVAGGAGLSLILSVLAASGIVVAWLSGANDPEAVFPGIAGAGLGLLMPRLPRAARGAGIPLARYFERAPGLVMRRLAAVCEYRLPRYRDRLQRHVAALWHGKAWTARIAGLEALLARWPTTALGMLFVAIAIGLLLLG